MPNKNPIKIETPEGKYSYGLGKRKTSVAKVRLYKGKGVIQVNGKSIKDYFAVKTNRDLAKSPLELTGNDKKFDITVLIDGGGNASQAEAIRHGISRALIEADPLTKASLKKAGYLRRDDRIKERKKPGLKKARKAPQFSKR